ncbi:hypothetical protein [Haliovirga abyssi]|uniref:DUF494 family protein n=1 Tax=Haliovirga abyssi TaxID=2996794 RepID=A0AAU9DKL4_9FUSO|nr:hypothetical protein [Haliovirga abyssi]BDU50442.1 hypothetical protein HLVA_10110 [Haliovirga abyssi]
MEKNNSKELAFFNILETALHFDLSEEKNNFLVSLNELKDKIGMDTNEILKNMKSLENNKILKIKEYDNNKILLDISNYKTKLSEVFTQEEIETILKEFNYFIKKYNLTIPNEKEIKKSSEILKNMILENPQCDLQEFIEKGITTAITEKILIKIEKKIYDLFNSVDDEDLKILEVTLFCMYNFDKKNNPFLVTLFLESVYNNMNKR